MKNIPVSKLNQNPLEEIRKQAYKAIAQKIATTSSVTTTVNDDISDEAVSHNNLFNDHHNNQNYQLDHKKTDHDLESQKNFSNAPT